MSGRRLQVRTEFGRPVLATVTVSRITGLSVSTVKRYCAQGIFAGAYQHQVAGDWKIPLDAVIAFLPPGVTELGDLGD